MTETSVSQSTAEECVARDVAFHPAKRVKVTRRRNEVKNDLICDLASR